MTRSDQKNFSCLMVLRDKIPSLWVGKVSSSRHGSRNRKLRVHVLHHKPEAERASWMWCEAFNLKALPVTYTMGLPLGEYKEVFGTSGQIVRVVLLYE